MTTAKTAVFRRHGEPMELLELPIPPLQSQEILIRNEMATLCRSDLTTYMGKRVEQTPTILGHEIIGRISAFGPESSPVDLRGQELRVGDRITWAIFASDPSSPMALKGMPQKSAGRFKYGHEQLTQACTLHGGLSQFTILRANTPILKIAESIPIQIATIINCAVATVAGALRMAGDIRGRTVLISGAGMLGVLACGMAKHSGASRIGAMDIEEKRLEVASKFGADFTLLAQQNDEGRQAIDTEQVDVIIEVSGVPSAMEKTIEMLSIGGIAVWIGATFPAPRVQLNAEYIVRNLISIRGLHNYNIDDFRSAVEFIERHHDTLPIRDLIHDHFTLDEVEQAFDYGIKANPFRVGIHL